MDLQNNVDDTDDVCMEGEGHYGMCDDGQTSSHMPSTAETTMGADMIDGDDEISSTIADDDQLWPGDDSEESVSKWRQWVNPLTDTETTHYDDEPSEPVPTPACPGVIDPAAFVPPRPLILSRGHDAKSARFALFAVDEHLSVLESHRSLGPRESMVATIFGDSAQPDDVHVVVPNDAKLLGGNIHMGHGVRSWLVFDWIAKKIHPRAMAAASLLFGGHDQCVSQFMRDRCGLDWTKIADSTALSLTLMAAFSIPPTWLRRSEPLRESLVNLKLLQSPVVIPDKHLLLARQPFQLTDSRCGDADPRVRHFALPVRPELYAQHAAAIITNTPGVAPSGDTAEDLANNKSLRGQLLSEAAGLDMAIYHRRVMEAAGKPVLPDPPKTDDPEALARHASWVEFLKQKAELAKGKPVDIPVNSAARRIAFGDDEMASIDRSAGGVMSNNYDETTSLRVKTDPWSVLVEAAPAAVAMATVGGRKSEAGIGPAFKMLELATELARSGVLIRCGWDRVALVQAEVACMVLIGSVNPGSGGNVDNADMAAYRMWASINVSGEEKNLSERTTAAASDPSRRQGGLSALEVWGQENQSEVGISLTRAAYNYFMRVPGIKAEENRLKQLWGGSLPVPMDNDSVISLVTIDATRNEIIAAGRLSIDAVLPVNGCLCVLMGNTVPKWMSTVAQIELWRSILITAAMRCRVDGIPDPHLKSTPDDLTSSAADGTDDDDADEKQIAVAHEDVSHGMQILMAGIDLSKNQVVSALRWCEGWFHPQAYVRGTEGMVPVLDEIMTPTQETIARRAARTEPVTLQYVSEELELDMRKFEKDCDHLETLAFKKHMKAARKQLKREHGVSNLSKQAVMERAYAIRGRHRQDTRRHGRAESLMVIHIECAVIQVISGLSMIHQYNIRKLRTQFGGQVWGGNDYRIRCMAYYDALWNLCLEHNYRELAVYERGALAAYARWIQLDRAESMWLYMKQRNSSEMVKYVDHATVEVVNKRRKRARESRRGTTVSAELALGPTQVPSEHWMGLTVRHRVNRHKPNSPKGLPVPVCNWTDPVSGHASVQEVGWVVNLDPDSWIHRPVRSAQDRPDAPTYLDMMELDNSIDLGARTEWDEMVRESRGLGPLDTPSAIALADEVIEDLKRLAIKVESNTKKAQLDITRQYRPPPTVGQRTRTSAKQERKRFESSEKDKQQHQLGSEARKKIRKRERRLRRRQTAAAMQDVNSDTSAPTQYVNMKDGGCDEPMM